MVPEVATGQQVHHKVKILPVLKGIVHVDEKRMVLEFGEDPSLTHHGLYAPLGQDPGLAHLLHREKVCLF